VAAAAHQAQEAALRLAAIGGRINYFGGLPKDRPTIQIDSNLVHYKELRLTGTTGCSSADCMKAAEIVNAGRIELGDLISHRFPLPQVLQAFQTAEGRQALKIVIET
jgi:L-iditol 2-dehydrogenase